MFNFCACFIRFNQHYFIILQSLNGLLISQLSFNNRIWSPKDSNLIQTPKAEINIESDNSKAK